MRSYFDLRLWLWLCRKKVPAFSKTRVEIVATHYTSLCVFWCRHDVDNHALLIFYLYIILILLDFSTNWNSLITKHSYHLSSSDNLLDYPYVLLLDSSTLHFATTFHPSIRMTALFLVANALLCNWLHFVISFIKAGERNSLLKEFHKRV